MKHRLAAAALGCLSIALPLNPATAAEAAASTVPEAREAELQELRAALKALQARLEALESQAAGTAAKVESAETRVAEAEATNDRQTDQLAMTRAALGSWVGNFTWKGDFRYRDETIWQDYSPDRNRDRIRLRAGFLAKVNDTTRVEVQLATGENGDPRSSNQSLTTQNQRKGIYLDLAYAEWKPLEGLTLTAGKMKYPWVRPGQSVLFDGDINPEGLAAAWTRGGFFASGFHTQLRENSASAEVTMTGGQAGYRLLLDSERRLVLGASLFRFNNLKGSNAFWEGGNNSFGNTLVNNIAGDACYSAAYNAATGRLCNDYRQAEVFAEYSTVLVDRPLVLYADVLRNGAAGNGLDTAWSAGAAWGKAADPGTWELGAFWQSIEKDALYAQYIDSDFGGGNTDVDGLVLRAGYAAARNWTLNATWFLNQTNLDRPVAVAGVGNVRGRDYQRLQLDLNFKF
ncbi:MAG: hypothetical protein RL026_229 [Pseudomonadota bacterium]|jgi:uncharacterized coiled-coil protein SlyX